MMRNLSDRRGIGALSEQTGCNIETIRYDERIGLMPRAAPSGGGHRLYEDTQVRRLGFIRRTRGLFVVTAIAEIVIIGYVASFSWRNFRYIQYD